jgi:hypothetical protein
MDVDLNDIKLAGFSVTMTTRRKLDRVLTQRSEGEDLMDHGRGSYEFELKGTLPLDVYMALLDEANKGGLRLKCEFGEHHVVLKTVRYRDDGAVYMLLVEDIVPDD